MPSLLSGRHSAVKVRKKLYVTFPKPVLEMITTTSPVLIQSHDAGKGAGIFASMPTNRNGAQVYAEFR